MEGKVAYIKAEDSRLPPETLLDEALKWFGDDRHLIIDEITSVGDWSGWLARNHDLQKGRLKLIVSSSRTGLVLPPKALRGGGGKVGQGVPALVPGAHGF
jgi:predicted AAA+ superfamily ATPase